MKNLYKTISAIVLCASMSAQTPFFTATTYRGAFEPGSTPMWTDGWTEWDPQNHVYAAPTVTVSTSITSNTTWTSGNVYLIQGLIYVKNGATLTIQAGTTILGDKNTPNSSLVITQGSKLNAQGTVSSPIVFTSNQAVGSRNIGDWGGIILLGNSTMNTPGDTANIEGIAATTDTRFGGGSTPNDDDNSGTLSYVRIEFGGYIFAPNKEINGLTLGAVGRGTTIDHVQVSFANDDAFEWFGGTVNCKYLVSYRNLDDDFDADNGYSGYVQFGLVVRDPSLADNPSVSTSEGFETDNDASGTSNAPLTQGIFSNITLIGPYRGNTGSSIASGFRRGARIRRNSNLKIFNSIFMDFVRGLHIDGSACEANIQSGAIKFENNIVAGTSTGKVTEVNTGSTLNLPALFAAGANDSLVSTSGILVTPYNYTAPDYRPATGSIAESGADFTDAVFNGLVSGVSESNAHQLKIFPNPANDILNVSVPEMSGKATVTIINALGQQMVITEIKAGNLTTSLNLSGLSNGVYFITLQDEKSGSVARFVINR